jgi:hypothetical protein
MFPLVTQLSIKILRENAQEQGCDKFNGYGASITFVSRNKYNKLAADYFRSNYFIERL